jgi:hypothetical protein
LLTCLLCRLLCGFVRLLARGGGERELEVVVLRHQVAILRRGGGRPLYTAADHALLAAVSRLLPPERWSCFAVSPQTLRRWHRALLQGNRRGRGRRPGRPPLAAGTRGLILRMARENPRWGYMRIRGELLKLGINVSATTIATVLRVSRLGPAPRRIGPSWSQLLRAQAQSMLDAGLPSEPAGGLEGNESVRSAPTREAALDVEAEELSTNGAEEWSSRPVQGLPRLSAVAAVPSPCDSTAAPLRSSQQRHARDGPRARRRSLHARTVRTGRQPRRLLAPGLRVATTGQVPSGAAARLSTRAAQHNGPNTASTRQLNRASLPHRRKPRQWRRPCASDRTERMKLMRLARSYVAAGLVASALAGVAGHDSVRSAASAQTCHYRLRGALPDPNCTPGARNPDVTPRKINKTICVKG